MLRMTLLLKGTWRITRSISDGSHLEGTAEFIPQGTHLHYTESGTLHLPDGTELHAERSYIFAPRDGGFAVYFDEKPMRLFHEIMLDDHGRGAAEHMCGDDLYRSIYTFHDHGGFTISHHVTGPKKEYEMVTEYVRKS